MADDINWTAYGLVEAALEDALVGHALSWAEVKAAALAAVDYIDGRVAQPTEEHTTAMT